MSVDKKCLKGDRATRFVYHRLVLNEAIEGRSKVNSAHSEGSRDDPIGHLSLIECHPLHVEILNQLHGEYQLFHIGIVPSSGFPDVMIENSSFEEHR